MKTLLLVPTLFAALAAVPSIGAPLASPAPGPQEYQIDDVHSAVMFKIKHAGIANFYGMFGKISGSFTLDADKPENCRVSIAIDAASVQTNNEGRDKHLRSPDFFDAKQYPEIRFTGGKFAANGDDLEVTGELELRGKKAPMTLHLAKTGAGEFRGQRVGYETTFTIKRSEFGMDYGIAKNALGDEVAITVSVQGVLGGGK